MFVREALPEHHLSTESKDVVKLGIALIATMSALVLSLLVASAKSAFDTRSNQLVQASADIILLDRALQRSLRSQALTTAQDVGRTRLLLFENLGSSIPLPFLVFWLCIIFASFGLFAPRNATVIAVLCVCALSVAGASSSAGS